MDTEPFSEYDKWNERKKVISIKNKKIFFKEREIWWCSLGLNVGVESYGKGETFARPVLIIKALSLNTCIALPITSQKKTREWFVEVLFKNEVQWVMVHQIRILDTKRFQHKLGRLEPQSFIKIKEKLEMLLELSR